MKKSEKLKNLLYIIVTFSIVFFVISFYARHYLGLGFPHFDFLFSFEDRFMDFYYVNSFISNLDPYIANDSSYPPLILLVAFLFKSIYPNIQAEVARTHFLGKLSFWIYLSFIVISYLYIIYTEIIKDNSKDDSLITKALKTSVFLLATPFLIMIDRGNYSYFAFFFIYLFFKTYHQKTLLSLIYLAIATAFRIYPAILFLIPLFDKQFKNVLIAVLFCLIVSLIPLFFFKGGFINNFVAFIDRLRTFQEGSIYGGLLDNCFSTSLKGLYQIPIMIKYDEVFPKSLEWLNTLYTILVILSIASAAFFLRKCKDLWIVWHVLITLMITAPYISISYNVLYILFPIFLFLKDDGKNKIFDLLMVWIYALLLIPKSYLVLFFSPPYFVVNIDSILNPLIFLSSLIVIAVFKFKENIEKRKS